MIQKMETNPRDDHEKAGGKIVNVKVLQDMPCQPHLDACKEN